MKRFLKFIFSTLLFVIGICLIAFVMMVGKTYKTNSETRQVTLLETASQVTESISSITANMDSQKTSQIMDFVKLKADDGSLKSIDGVKAAIREGAEEFDLEISESTALQMTDALESLEDMGFSVEDIAQKTQNLYSKYGDEFVNHMEEAFVDAAKDAAQNTAQNLWDSVEETVKKLF